MAPTAHCLSPAAMQDVSVLLVDDDAFARSHVTLMLERVVGVVHVAETGEEGLRLFRETSPDILIIDILMPGMDGLELSRRIRETDPDVPIFIATGVDEPELVVRALEQDVDQLLLKPILPEPLLGAIRKTVRRIAMRRRLMEAETSLRLLMDSYPNFVLLVDEGRVSYVNEGMLSHLGLDSFEAFRCQETAVGDLFSELDGKPYDGGEDWIRTIVDDPLDREHMVRMPNPRDPARRPGTYVVRFKEFPTPGKYLFTLTDVSELDDRSRHLEDQAATDPLTGAANRRSFMDLMERVAAGARPYCLVMFDLDHFKRVNDDYGHDVGDSVLKELAALVRNNIRNSDVLARWGGEEFMVVTPDSDLRRASRVAERLRRKIEGYDFKGVRRVVTSSIGVAAHQPGEALEDLVQRVDAALYKAKNAGRNRVVVG